VSPLLGTHPRVTITLVAYEGLRWLPACVASVRSQRVDDWELLALDNGSTDGSRAWLAEQASMEQRIVLTEFRTNLGFARGHNALLGAARGEAVLVLNQDVVLDPGFLEAALRVLDERPEVGAVQGRLRRMNGSGERTNDLDSTGLVMARDRRATSRGQAAPDDGTSRVRGSVFGADGPAPVFRRAALLDARLPRPDGHWEVLDEDFFMYKEDVDLAWRLRLLGWSAWYEPAALAWHARTAPGARGTGWLGAARTTMEVPAWIRAISWRNQRLMQVKNDRPREFLRDLPWIAGREVASLAFLLVADPRRLAILPSLLRLMPRALRKRRYLMRKSRVRGVPPLTFS
jgi:GT2 family glycosyltransferase